MATLTLYQIVLFLHVASAVELFGVLALEGVSLRGLARSVTYEQAREWAGLWSLLLPLGLPAAIVVLASGIYLATKGGSWDLSWVGPAVPVYVLVVVAGAIVGPRRNRLWSVIAAGAGPLPSDVHLDLCHPLLSASWRLRTALLSGLLFVMTVKPQWALWAITSFALLGTFWSLSAWWMRPRSSHAGDHERRAAPPA